MKSRTIKIVGVFLVCLFFKMTFVAQESIPPGQFTTTNKKAIKAYQEGKRNYDARQDKKAEELFLKAIKEDPRFMEPYFILAILCQEQRRYKESVGYFKQAIDVAPKFEIEKYYRLAELEFALGSYVDAKTHYENYLSFPRINPEYKEAIEFRLKCVEFAIDAVNHPKPVEFSNAGPAINTENSEYFPSLTVDENYFLFTRRLPDNMNLSGFQEDLFISRAGKGGWMNAKLAQELSSMSNEGAPCISADGNYMFITMSQDINGTYMGGSIQGYGSCDIFFTQRVNGRWTKPLNLGPKINSSAWESQPSFSSDGKTLYFVRGTPQRGAVKGIDIYCSVIGPDGKFSQPERLPSNINTNQDEASVFIHSDNQTLYFSSEGHIGMGGADIYVSKRKPDGTWGDPVNLGYPINTSKDENSLLVAPSGRLAYFASDRDGGYGELDIYQFKVPEDMRPEKITYVKGKIYDAKTKEPLEARFELVDIATEKQTVESFSQKNGEFLVTLTANKNYLVNVSRPGYLFYSDNFSLKNTEVDFSKPYLLDIPLEPIELNAAVELKNIFFDVDKWDLKPESKAELDKLIAFLTNNASLKIELSGHTDNSGDKKANLLLSANRAQAVYNYLVNTGKISATRLSHKGYGDTMPKVPNDSPENKAKNRRTEFKVIAK